MMHRLQDLSPCPLEITWHENKTTYIQTRKTAFGLELKLHRLFYDAPIPVLEAILDFALKKDSQAKTIIRQMAYLYFSQNKFEPKELIAQGKVYDLQQMFDACNQQFFLKGITIGWSERNLTKRFRSMTFGCYDHTCQQIRIHPLLDDVEVPRYFVEFVVYHETLHAIYPPKIGQEGRFCIHSKEFREQERKFPQFLQAKAWEKNSLEFFKKRRRYGRA